MKEKSKVYFRRKLMYRTNSIFFLFADKPLDWKNINLKKMKVKELKKILTDWGETCKACTEKTDFVKRIEELKPKHVKEEL